MSELSQLQALLPSLPDAVARTRFGDSLKQIAQEVGDVATRAADAKALIEIAAITKFATNEHRTELLEEMTGWCSLTAKALKAADTDLTLREAKDSYGKFKKAQNSLRSALGEHWDAVRRAQYEPLSAYGDILGLVPDLGRLAQGFKDCAVNSRKIGMAQGPQALLAHILAMRAELAGLQQSRSETVKDPSVGEFLNALADRAATLGHLTDEVIVWLREHNAVGRFRVTPLA